MEAAPSSRPDIPGTSAGQWCPLVVAAQPGSAAHKLERDGFGQVGWGRCFWWWGQAVLAHGDTREALTTAPCGGRGLCSISGGWRSGAGQMGGARMQSEGWSSRAVGLGSARQSDHPSLKTAGVSPGPTLRSPGVCSSTVSLGPRIPTCRHLPGRWVCCPAVSCHGWDHR